jgi:hypothetical protein
MLGRNTFITGKLILTALLLLATACTSTSEVNTSEMSKSDIQLELAKINHSINTLKTERRNNTAKSNNWLASEIKQLKSKADQLEEALIARHINPKSQITTEKITITPLPATKTKRTSLPKTTHSPILKASKYKIARFPNKDFSTAKEVPLRSISQFISSFKRSINRPESTLVLASSSARYVYLHYQEDSYEGFLLIKGFDKQAKTFTEAIIVPIN